MDATTVHCECMTCFVCGQDKGESTYSKNKDSTVHVQRYSETLPSMTLITQKRKQLAQQKSNQLQKKYPLSFAIATVYTIIETTVNCLCTHSLYFAQLFSTHCIFHITIQRNATVYAHYILTCRTKHYDFVDCIEQC